MEKTDKGKNSLHIKEWPIGERPREMLLEKGPEALSDEALLAILLRTGRQGQDAVALAREMLTKFGGYRGLMSATYEDLIKTKGIGKAKIGKPKGLLTLMAKIIAAFESTAPPPDR